MKTRRCKKCNKDEPMYLFDVYVPGAKPKHSFGVCTDCKIRSVSMSELTQEVLNRVNSEIERNQKFAEDQQHQLIQRCLNSLTKASDGTPQTTSASDVCTTPKKNPFWRLRSRSREPPEP